MKKFIFFVGTLFLIALVFYLGSYFGPVLGLQGTSVIVDENEESATVNVVFNKTFFGFITEKQGDELTVVYRLFDYGELSDDLSTVKVLVNKNTSFLLEDLDNIDEPEEDSLGPLPPSVSRGTGVYNYEPDKTSAIEIELDDILVGDYAKITIKGDLDDREMVDGIEIYVYKTNRNTYPEDGTIDYEGLPLAGGHVGAL